MPSPYSIFILVSSLFVHYNDSWSVILCVVGVCACTSKYISQGKVQQFTLQIHVPYLTVLCLTLLTFTNTYSHISAQRRGIWMVERVIGPEEMRASDDKLREEMRLKLLRMLFFYHNTCTCIYLQYNFCFICRYMYTCTI